MDLALVKILNPNPRSLLVLDRGRKTHDIEPKGELVVVVTADLRLAVARGKSKVVLTGEGVWEGEQWVQEVSATPTKVHPDLAMKDASDAP